jgi:uncharacterized protein
MRIVLLALASLAINGLLGYYGWRRLVKDTILPRTPRLAATWAIVIGQLLVPATMSANRLGATTVVDILQWPAFLWMAFFALTIVALWGIDLGRLIVWAVRRAMRKKPLDLERRRLIARITGGAALAVGAGQVVVGMRNALGDHEVVDVPVTLHRLPRALDGFTIVQLTDMHIGLTVDRDFVSDVVRRVNQLEPDLIALTGDIVDGRRAELAGRAAPLAALRAPHGVFMVTGNHEYYSGVDEWIAELTVLGVRVLRNERVAITRDGASFDLVGIDDHSARSFGKGHGSDLAGAMVGRDPDRAVVLLAHQPRQVELAVRHDVDLQLSGHTHGGQIWPWHHLVAIQQGGFVAGRYTRGKTQLYVSRGVGYWGPPVRIGAPAEITRIILRYGETVSS